MMMGKWFSIRQNNVVNCRKIIKHKPKFNKGLENETLKLHCFLQLNITLGI